MFENLLKLSHKISKKKNLQKENKCKNRNFFETFLVIFNHCDHSYDKYVP